MKTENVRSDVTVVGGGLSGVCAAIAAARSGAQVALIQNRPVLGGNSSSEVRVWVSGASAVGKNRYARETGIMGELFLENQFRNPDGNPYIWDSIVYEAVLKESNIRLYLNTNVHEIQTGQGERESCRIESVTGWMMGSERVIRFESPLFVDCTGDGLIGFLAGAEYRIGRESKAEFNESLAPEQADSITLGSTLLFYTKNVGYPVKYVAPAFAKNIADTPIPLNRLIRSGDSGCDYWWIEWGGELDTVHENERIRDELWSVIYGIWDYIKNSGRFEADTLTLEWVGSVPGKREYRRLIGDYILHQNDILAQTPFEDRVAFGGWSIDLHPPGGMYDRAGGSKHVHADGVYHIPFRCLYSRNIRNLLFAGRNISASHIAFGTTRVMATCAAMGEAAGTAAALCMERKIGPRELYLRCMADLQQDLLKNDASIVGIGNNDPRDLARTAGVEASSYRQTIELDRPVERFPLHNDAGILIPVTTLFEGAALLLDASALTELRVELYATGKKENYIPAILQQSVSLTVAPGSSQWVPCEFSWIPDEPQNAFIVIRSNPLVSLYLHEAPFPGVLGFVRHTGSEQDAKLEERDLGQPILAWSMKPVHRKPFCLLTLAATEAYRPESVIDGYHRPYGGPHMWVSDRMSNNREEWIALEWPDSIPFDEIHLTFNDDVNEYLNNLHFIRTEFEALPEVIRNYRIEALTPAGWKVIHRETGNYKRKRIHRFAAAVESRALKVVAETTNGSEYAQIVEIRIYNRQAYRK